jgi:hypothetical protein
MGHELGAAIGDNRFGRIFIPEDSVNIKPSYIFRSNNLIIGERNGLLTKIIYYNENYIVTFLVWGYGLEIYNNVLPGTVRDR